MDDEPDRDVSEHTDAPLETKVALLAVLAITAAAFATVLLNWIDPGRSRDIAPILWLFTGLFAVRVSGQILVALRPQRWLPPMEQWNFIPYPILLPIQLIFIVVMVWIDISFSANDRIATVRNPELGDFLIGFSAVYATAMAVRYFLRMFRHPDQRWFGGTIPIVFHLVLASYLYTLGRYYVSP